MTTLRVKLPSDRRKTGTIELIDPFTGLTAFGPVPVLGRAARDTAKRMGNPSGDPLRRYGDTPLGVYSMPSVLSSGQGTSHPAPAYGSAGVIVLDPVGGDAALAKANGRTGLLIHSGRQPATPTPLPSHLKPTNGCLRMLEGDLSDLIQAMRDHAILFPGSIQLEVTSDEGPAGADDDTVDEGDPPPLSGDPELP